jgi:hypothetical protein
MNERVFGIPLQSPGWLDDIFFDRMDKLTACPTLSLIEWTS